MSNISNEEELPKQEVTVEEIKQQGEAVVDFYHILGVPHDATEKQINTAYKKLALKYHPDRNTDPDQAEEASKKFKLINDAYQVLVDHNKRRQYDVHRNVSTMEGGSVGSKDVSEYDTSVDVTSLGGIGRVFGAMISKFGIPIPTQINIDVVHTAQEICSNGGIEGGGPPLDPRVIDLTWGWGNEGKVDRQAAAFYRLTVDHAHAEKGFVINVRSMNKGKFKLIMFDKDGCVLHQEESNAASSSPPSDASKERLPVHIPGVHSNSYTQATFYFTKFDTYRLEDIHHTNQEKGKDGLPPLFNRLDTLSNSKKKIVAGQYLLCVYGDNFIGKTNFNIVAVPSKNDASEVGVIEEADESLMELKRQLTQLKNEYVASKAAYDAVLHKMKENEDKLHLALTKREKAYSGFLDNSIGVFDPLDTTNHNPDAPPMDDNNTYETKARTSSNEGAFGFFASAATTATNNAAQTATAATGWLARRFSIIQAFVKPSDDEASSSSDSGSATEATAETNQEHSNVDSVSDGTTTTATTETTPAPIIQTHVAVVEEVVSSEELPVKEEEKKVAEVVTRPSTNAKRKNNKKQQHHKEEEEATPASPAGEFDSSL